MIKHLYDLIWGKLKKQHNRLNDPPPEVIKIGELPPFPFSEHISQQKKFPIADWDSIIAWIGKIKSSKLQEEAWNACEKGWLLQFLQALGPKYFFSETNDVRMISPLSVQEAQSAMGYVEYIVARIIKTLPGLAENPPDKELLILFDDDKTYYNYVSLYYAKDSKHSPSDGRCIRSGCLHFAVRQTNLAIVERLLVREITHLCLSHLQIPCWLNRGLIAYTEQQFGLRESPDSQQRLISQHKKFWNEKKIQRFWSGDAFKHAKSSEILLDDLAHRIVEQMAKRWERFTQFVLIAAPEDGGHLAASDYLGLDLGEYITSMLLEEPITNWSPDPETWPHSSRPNSSLPSMSQRV